MQPLNDSCDQEKRFFFRPLRIDFSKPARMTGSRSVILDSNLFLWNDWSSTIHYWQKHKTPLSSEKQGFNKPFMASPLTRRVQVICWPMKMPYSFDFHFLLTHKKVKAILQLIIVWKGGWPSKRPDAFLQEGKMIFCWQKNTRSTYAVSSFTGVHHSKSGL